ncbi:MAG: hypothetical protein ACU85V_16035 [Gammaproteobacteria bacterium]
MLAGSRRSRTIGAITFVLLASAAPAQAEYDFSAFTVPGAIRTYPQAVNDYGLVTGYFDAAGTSGDASFLYNHHSGQLRLFAAPGAAAGSTRAWGLNNVGDVVGHATVGGVQQGFIWHMPTNSWSFENYSEGATRRTVIYAITDDGTHFGGAERYLRLQAGQSPQWTSRPYRVVGDTRDWLPSGSNDASLRVMTPYDVNNTGTVFGTWYDIGYDAVSFPTDGSARAGYREYGYPGTSVTFGYGVNDAGYLTGTRSHPNPAVGSGGWVRSPAGTFTSVAVPFADALRTESVRDIDSAGALVGAWVNTANEQLGFIARPTSTAPAAAGAVAERYAGGVASYRVENTGATLDTYAVLIATATAPTGFGTLPTGWSARGVDIVGEAAFVDATQILDLGGLGFEDYAHGALFFTDAAPLAPGQALDFSAYVGAPGSPFAFVAAPLDLGLDNSAYLTAAGTAVPLPPSLVLLALALPFTAGIRARRPAGSG